MLKLSLSVAVLATLGSAAYAADARGDFIATWATSPQPIWGPDFLAPVKVPRNFWNQTLREVATISQGGKQVRLVLSNLYGTTPLPISAAHVAVAGDNGAIQPGSDHAVTFDGQPGVVIPPGRGMDQRSSRLPGRSAQQAVRQPLLPRCRPGDNHSLGGTRHCLHHCRQYGRRRNNQAVEHDDRETDPHRHSRRRAR